MKNDKCCSIDGNAERLLLDYIKSYNLMCKKFESLEDLQQIIRISMEKNLGFGLCGYLSNNGIGVDEYSHICKIIFGNQFKNGTYVYKTFSNINIRFINLDSINRTIGIRALHIMDYFSEKYKGKIISKEMFDCMKEFKKYYFYEIA